MKLRTDLDRQMRPGENSPYGAARQAEAPASDSAATLASLFAGRPDALGLTLKSGRAITWSSHCSAGYYVRCGEIDAANARLLEHPVCLGREHFAAHLRGELDIGVLPLLENGTCRWGAVDFDGDKFSSPAECNAAARRVVATLRGWGLRPHLFTSRSRGFHALVFFTAAVSASAIRTILAAALREANLPATTERFPKQDHPSLTDRGLGNWLRCPYPGGGAPGRRVALDDAGEPLGLDEFLRRVKPVPAERIIALAAKLSAQAQIPISENRAALACARRELSAAITHLLRHGGPTQPKPDRSRWVLSIALGFVNAGRPFEEFFAEVRDRRNKGGAKVQQIAQRKGLKTARDYAEGRWRRAQQRVATNPPFRSGRDASGAILKVKQAVETCRWDGRTGPMNRAVVIAHLDIASRTGRLVHHASVRDVADFVGATSRTVRAAHRRLAAARWLRCVRPASDKRAATWKLQIPTRVCEAGAPYHLTSEGVAGLYGAVPSHPLTDPGCDVWRHGRGRGKGGWRAWLALDPPATTREIARHLGVGVRSVQQRLARFAQYGLAERDAQGRWHRLEPDAATLADRLGVGGAGQRQRWRHEDERETHHKAVWLRHWKRQRKAAQRGRRDAGVSDRSDPP